MNTLSASISQEWQVFAPIIGACHLPLFSEAVSAGFPSPASDYIEQQLDLNELIIKHPAATFFVRAQGESMCGAGIHPGDILVVDRSLEALSGKIIVAVVNGEFTVKRLRIEAGQLTLLPENPSYKALKIDAGVEFQVWGVVSYVIHRAL